MGNQGNLPGYWTVANGTVLARNMLSNTCQVLCEIAASNLWIRLLALRTYSNCQVYKYFWMTGRTKGVNLLIYIKGGIILDGITYRVLDIYTFNHWQVTCPCHY